MSLTLTPLAITDGLAGWDGLGEQVPCDGHAILFGRSMVAVLPDDLPAELALAVLDVCGAPALTDRVVRGYVAQASAAARAGQAAPVTVAVLGGAGKSGSLSLAAARRGGGRAYRRGGPVGGGARHAGGGRAGRRGRGRRRP